MVVGECSAALLENPPEASPVAAEDQELGRTGNPRRGRKQRIDRGALGLVAHPQNIGLLQIAFGGRCQRRGAEQAKQVLRQRVGTIAAAYRSFVHRCDGIEVRCRRVDLDDLAEAAIRRAQGRGGP
jgi:hypothetical protein